MNSMTFLEECIAKQIEILKAETEMMIKLSCSWGFIEVFNEEIKVSTPEIAFASVNLLYRTLFGEYRYKDYADFVNKTQGDNNVNKLARSYLMAWFKSKGFDTWQSFSPLVLHYYPQVTKAGLLAFYEDKIFTADTLKKVEYVKQIIGE